MLVPLVIVKLKVYLFSRISVQVANKGNGITVHKTKNTKQLIEKAGKKKQANDTSLKNQGKELGKHDGPNKGAGNPVW